MDFKKKRLTVMVLAALTVTASANAAAAQDTARQVSVQKDVQKTAELSDEYALDDVTVTATKVEEKVKDVPASITVITAADIKKRHVTSVREILQNETGIYMAPTAETKDGISLRGFGSKNILVLYNGQQVNTSFDGGIAWDTFPIEEIERIEIVRGASSSLYGGHAVAGVINIITKSGKGKPGEIKTNLVVSGGSNRTWNRSIRVSGSASEKFDFNVGYEKRSTGGYRGYYTTASGKPSGSAATTVDLPKLSDGTYIIGGRGRKDKQSENYFADFTYAMSPDKKLNFSYMHNTYRYNYLDAFTNAYDANGNGIFSGTVKTQEGTYVTLKPSSYLGYHGEREQDIYKLHYDDAKNKIKASIGISDITKEGYSSASSSANIINWSGAGSSAQYPSKNYSTDFQKT
jgi:iron complex outermembrane recepter protein